ncbi:hypothetical protein MMC09_006011 [Bachmanniomyces sp. S44760]|nr:hypothetical protein [Bachmanniomyces sp. S44760]
MTTPPPPQPKLSIFLSLDPKTYSFNEPHISRTPPTLSLNLISHSPTPLTLFTWTTPLNPRTGLGQAQLPITDLSTIPPTAIPQSRTRIQRLPFSRARGSGDEPYFLTLYPEIPVIVSTGFTRGGADGPRPQPRSVVERGREIDEVTGEVKEGTRRSVAGCGVDGLESGHRYRVDVDREAIEGVWWRYGTKEDVIVDKGSRMRNLWEIERGEGNLEVVGGEIPGVEFQVL